MVKLGFFNEFLQGMYCCKGIFSGTRISYRIVQRSFKGFFQGQWEDCLKNFSERAKIVFFIEGSDKL